METLYRIGEDDRERAETVLSVARDHQGKGVGGKLLAALCRKADTERRALYLETQTSRNVAWYEGHGISVLKNPQRRSA